MSRVIRSWLRWKWGELRGRRFDAPPPRLETLGGEWGDFQIPTVTGKGPAELYAAWGFDSEGVVTPLTPESLEAWRQRFRGKHPPNA
jgi:hypothetical protein